MNEYKTIGFDREPVRTNRKRFPLADMHQISQINLKRDNKNRLETQYMKRYSHSIENHVRDVHNRINSTETHPEDVYEVIDQKHVDKNTRAGIKNLTIEGDNGNRMPISRRNITINRNKGSPNIDTALHLNRSRRRILHNFVPEAEGLLLKNGRSMVTLPHGPIPNEREKYFIEQ
jgi:hypothetical protein